MTDDEGYDHSRLCTRCHGRGFEPLHPPESDLSLILFWIFLGAAGASFWWALAWTLLR